MWKSSLQLFRNEHFIVLLCNKALITIDLKWLKATQNLTGSPFKVKNYQLQPTLERGEYSKSWKYILYSGINTKNKQPLLHDGRSEKILKINLIKVIGFDNKLNLLTDSQTLKRIGSTFHSVAGTEGEFSVSIGNQVKTSAQLTQDCHQIRHLVTVF